MYTRMTSSALRNCNWQNPRSPECSRVFLVCTWSEKLIILKIKKILTTIEKKPGFYGALSNLILFCNYDFFYIYICKFD